ncbi:Molecular chaperone IbpA, HSP20 family [Halopenitus malekzadehii]|uniref:Molecular chaperone IbpA, HSP20 family n=1 Tax=Halopenitus malekzadehii TaxID=1267564 RepID=A0A1H6HRW4_9EURY|nr:Hsp20/alpha crystallin family protein [Halopenitus malekzadehii]SEH37800.1 Molecular chaperone IbpA, HSP20 family [Halopenitus malekzadehii]
MTGVFDVGRTAIRSALERVGRGWGSIQERRPLDHDLLEGPDAYRIVFDAPGVHRTDVDVRFVDRTVEVYMERDRGNRDRDGFEWVFPGRGRSLSGTATLPTDAEVTPTGAEATLTRSGTLEVTIPKDAAAGSVHVTEEDAENGLMSDAESDDAE